ncbi:MAG: hypothetical protein JWR26_3050, partial [Pedosphaera sp.]|nr:hypothetical protein [Pedosphaera sp.]
GRGLPGRVRCLRTATIGTGMAGVRMERWRVPGLTFGFTLLRSGTSAARCKGGLAHGCLPMGFLRAATRQHCHFSGGGKKAVFRSFLEEKGCVSFGFRRLPSPSVGLGGGLIFFHGVLADCHYLHGSRCAESRAARDTGCHGPPSLRSFGVAFCRIGRGDVGKTEGRFNDMNHIGAKDSRDLKDGKDLKDAAGCLGGLAGLADGAGSAALCTMEDCAKGGQGMKISCESSVRERSKGLQRPLKSGKGRIRPHISGVFIFSGERGLRRCTGGRSKSREQSGRFGLAFGTVCIAVHRFASVCIGLHRFFWGCFFGEVLGRLGGAYK